MNLVPRYCWKHSCRRETFSSSKSFTLGGFYRLGGLFRIGLKNTFFDKSKISFVKLVAFVFPVLLFKIICILFLDAKRAEAHFIFFCVLFVCLFSFLPRLLTACTAEYRNEGCFLI